MSQTSKVVAFRGKNEQAPNIENGKVPPVRRKNREVRSREHLTPDKVERLMAAARSLGRHGHRDATSILMTFRHGLRVSELVALRWDMVDLKQGLLHVSRLKNGVTSTHPIRGPELRALRKLQRDYPDTPYVFVSERQGPLTTAGVRKIVARAKGIPQRLVSRYTLTCCVTPQATSWLTTATTRGQSNTTWGTRTSSTPFATQSLRPAGSRIFGRTDPASTVLTIAPG